MEYKFVEKKDFMGKKVKVLDATYEPGEPEIIGVGEDLGWRKHNIGKEDMLKYLRSAQRYWYSDDWYGSEKKR